MTRPERLRRNPRILFWCRALTELKFLNGIVVLFYLHRGLSLDQIFYLSIAWSVATLIFEVPTGYLADRVGRKRTLLIGVLLLIVAQLITYIAFDFPMFVLAFILMSVGFSCFSGTEEAVLYDSLKELGEEGNMTRHNGRLHAARHFFKIVTPTLGAFIAQDLLEWQFQTLIASDAVAILMAGVIISQLTEPRHVRDVSAHEKHIFRESLDTIKGDPFLFRVAMNKIFIFVASFIIWRAYQPLLSDLGLSVIWFGIFYFVMHLCIFCFHWLMGDIETHIGSPSILFWSVLVAMVCLFPLFITRNVWVAFSCSLLAIIVTASRESVFAHTVNRRIASHHRATILSNLQVFKSLVDVPVLLAAGWLATFDVRYTFAIAFGLCLVVIIFFPVRSSDLAQDQSNHL